LKSQCRRAHGIYGVTWSSIMLIILWYSFSINHITSILDSGDYYKGRIIKAIIIGDRYTSELFRQSDSTWIGRIRGDDLRLEVNPWHRIRGLFDGVASFLEPCCQATGHTGDGAGVEHVQGKIICHWRFAGI